jgi:hypothetical protein
MWRHPPDAAVIGPPSNSGSQSLTPFMPFIYAIHSHAV